MYRTIAGLLLMGLLLLPGPARAQTEPAPETEPVVERLASEMQGINATLERLVTLLETSVYHQRVELVLRRIQLKESRIAPLERRVANTEDEVLSRESEISQIEAMLVEQREIVSEQLRSGVEPDTDDQQMVEEFEMHLKIMRDEVAATRLRFQELEIDLERRRYDIAILDELLTDLLDE